MLDQSLRELQVDRVDAYYLMASNNPSLIASDEIHGAFQAVSSEIPVRIIIGHADRIIDWRDTIQLSPAVAIHHFPNAGHMPHWDQPKDVAEIILASQRY